MPQPEQNSRFIVGLTGGISCGKSVISGYFSELGIDIIDADQVARQVVEPGSDLLRELTVHFGTGILNQDKSLNRSELRKIVFQDDSELQFLNGLMHPAIHRRIKELIGEATSDYIILVVPLLFENHLEYMVDRILVANAKPETQVQRTIDRDGCSRQVAMNIMAKQVSADDRCAKADDIIHTDECTLREIRQHVIELDHIYKQFAHDLKNKRN